ncbi:MAG: hypothetical protein ATN35_04025, partial [Epulopiscium sp. Nele67-Bin004]
AMQRTKQVDDEYNKIESWYNIIDGIAKKLDVEIKFDAKYNLYKWEDAYCLADVIKDRRTMHGLSQAKLAEGICSTQTVFRVETKKRTPHPQTTKELLQKLGLIGDLCVDRVPYVDLETFNLDFEIRREFSLQNYLEMEEKLEQLINKVDMTDSNNIQCIGHKQIIVEWVKGNITTEQYYDYLVEALELTANIKNILQKPDKIHLNFNELELIVNIMKVLDEMGKQEEALKWLKVVEKYLEKTNWTILSISRYIFYANTITSVYGNIGKFEWSNCGSYETLYYGVANNIWQNLDTTIYGIGWNFRQEIETVQNRAMTKKEQKKYIDIMKAVYTLSEIEGNKTRSNKVKVLIEMQKLI